MSKETAPQTRLYAVRTTAGQEANVALLIERRAIAQKLPVKAIVAPDAVKGYVFVEAPGPHVVDLAVTGLKHVKGYVTGKIEFADVEKFISPKPVIEELSLGDKVEIVSGPFRGMKAKVVRIDKARSEVTLELLEKISYPLPITVNAEYVKVISKASGGSEGSTEQEEV